MGRVCTKRRGHAEKRAHTRTESSTNTKRETEKEPHKTHSEKRARRATKGTQPAEKKAPDPVEERTPTACRPGGALGEAVLDALV